MGHFSTTVRGKGKNQREAERNAVDEFLHENGDRHSIRHVINPKFIEQVPPMGVESCEGRTTIFDFTKPNVAAPKTEWLELWEFTLESHA